MRQRDVLTYQEAIDLYFLGVGALSKQSLPFKCKCGENVYKFKDDDGHYSFNPIMSVDDCFKHIRRNHKQAVRNKGKERREYGCK